MIIKLGQIYQTRDGKPVYIVRIFPVGFRNNSIYRVMGFIGESNNPKYWTVKGKFYSVSVDSCMDLVPREINLDLPSEIPLRRKIDREKIRKLTEMVLHLD